MEGGGGVVSIMGVTINGISYRQVIEFLSSRIAAGKRATVVAINPEKLVAARKDKNLKRVLDQATIKIADGIGIVLASKILGQPLPGRVTGVDLVGHILAEANRQKHSVFLLGAAPGVAEQVKSIVQEKHLRLGVAGAQHGFFPKADCEQVIGAIQAAEPDILLVALGSPRQEFFIQKVVEQTDVPVCMGVGGSFDIIAGRVPRAPAWCRKIGLEWCYRIARQPKRILRAWALIEYIFYVLGDLFRAKFTSKNECIRG